MDRTMDPEDEHLVDCIWDEVFSCGQEDEPQDAYTTASYPQTVSRKSVASFVSDWRARNTAPLSPSTVQLRFTQTEEESFVQRASRTKKVLDDLPLGRVPDRIQCQLQGANAFGLAFFSPSQRYRASTTFMSGLTMTETTSCRLHVYDDPSTISALSNLANGEYIVIDTHECTRQKRFNHQLGLVAIWKAIENTHLLLAFDLSHYADIVTVTVIFYDRSRIQLPFVLHQHQAELHDRWQYVTAQDRKRLIKSIDTHWTQKAVQTALSLSSDLTYTVPLDTDQVSRALGLEGTKNDTSNHRHRKLDPIPPLTKSIIKSVSMELGELALHTPVDSACSVTFPTLWNGEVQDSSLVLYRNTTSVLPRWLEPPRALPFPPALSPRKRSQYSFVGAAVQRWIPKDVPTELELVLPFDPLCQSFTVAVLVRPLAGPCLLDSMHVVLHSRHSHQERLSALTPLSPGLAVRFGLTLHTDQISSDSLSDLFSKRVRHTPTTSELSLNSPLRKLIFSHSSLYRNKTLHNDVAERITRLAAQSKLPLHVDRQTIMHWLKQAHDGMSSSGLSSDQKRDERETLLGIVGKAAETDQLVNEGLGNARDTSSNPLSRTNERRRALFKRGRELGLGSVGGTDARKKPKLE